MTDAIRVVDLTKNDPKTFKQSFADCVVLTKDNKILLQQRPPKAGETIGALTAFGGHIENGETPMQGLIRELNEELGAVVSPENVIEIAAITESFTNHTDIIYTYFWHDKDGTITGCYEWDSISYETTAEALAHAAIMDYLCWLLTECEKRGLIK